MNIKLKILGLILQTEKTKNVVEGDILVLISEDCERAGTLDHPCGMSGFVQVQEDSLDRGNHMNKDTVKLSLVLGELQFF